MSGFMSALMDPGVDALAGMAQGFAQAAMPSRMPIPFGAALGMGASGALQGAGLSERLQQAQQQVAAQRMQNQLMSSQLPYQMARNKYMAGLWSNPAEMRAMMNGIYGTGNGLPVLPGASSGAAPSSAAPSGYVGPDYGSGASGSLAYDYTKANQAALASLPNDTARIQAETAIKRAGLMPNQIAPFISMVANESGWNPNAPATDIGPGGIGHVGYGQIGRKAASDVGYTPQQVQQPLDNLVASALYFKRQWGGTTGTPNAAFSGYNTGVAGTPDPNYTNRANARLALWGYPGMPQPTMRGTPTGYRPTQVAGPGGAQPAGTPTIPPATSSDGRVPGPPTAGGAPLMPDGTAPVPVTPGDALTLSQQYLAAANHLQAQQAIAKMMNLPMPAGDPAALRTAAMQYRDLALSASKYKTQAEWQVYADRMKPQITRNGIYDPMTGTWRATPQYHPVADANGVTHQALVTDQNGQLVVEGGTGTAGAAPAPPQGPPVVPQAGKPSPDGSFYGGYPPLPPNDIQSAPGAGPLAALGPGQEEAIKAAAHEYATVDESAFHGANMALFQINQLDQNIRGMNANGGWSTTGPGVDFRMGWAAHINTALQALGEKPIFDPTKVGDWQEAEKLQSQLAFAQARQMGSREAMQIVQMSRAATPGAQNTPAGYEMITAGMREMQHREIDLFNYQTYLVQHNEGNPLGADAEFNKIFTPQMYAMRAQSSVKPIQINTLDQKTAEAQMAHMLPGTLVRFPNGKQMLVPNRPGWPPAPQYMLRLQQPGAPNGG